MDEALLSRAVDVVRPLAAEAERNGRLHPESVAALAAAGVFKLLVPRDYGGAEGPVEDYVRALESVARADGAAGWIGMIGATSGVMAAYLPDAIAREVYAAPDALTTGVFAPTGRAELAGDRVRVTGRWTFSSGCELAAWRMGGVVITEGGRPRLLPNGAPDLRCVLLRADETRVERDWDVLGLRATGSHATACDGVEVPLARCFSLFEPARHAGDLYRVPAFGMLAAGVAAVCLGIAAAALDRFVALAREKVPAGARRALAHRELVQRDVARAEALVASARQWLLEAARRTPGDGSLEARATLRLASCHAARSALEAVRVVCDAAGAGATRDAEPLQKLLRDVQVAAQHAMVAEAVAVLAGRVRLGVETDAGAL